MADAPVVHIGENSPENIAYKLMHDLMRAERRTFYHGTNDTVADRAYTIALYSECLAAVRGYRIP
jgi:hypothetical protein